MIYDELAQAKNRNLYDVLDTSFGARDEPLFIVDLDAVERPRAYPLEADRRWPGRRRPGDRLPSARRRRRLSSSTTRCNGARPIRRSASFRDYEDLVTAIAQGQAHAGGGAEGAQPVSQSAGGADRLADLARRMDGVRRRQASSPTARRSISRSTYRASLDLTALMVGSVSDPLRVGPYFWKPAII